MNEHNDNQSFNVDDIRRIRNEDDLRYRGMTYEEITRDIHERAQEGHRLMEKIMLDKARQLHKDGKPIKPDFDDFIDFYEMYGEVEFTYNKVIYGMTGANDEGVQFWACNVPVKERIPVVYASVEDFIANARIDGVLVKDLWDKIENPGTLK